MPSAENAPHHPMCKRDESGRYACDPRCPDPHGGERCGYVIPPEASER